MAGKQAKILSAGELRRALARAAAGQQPQRDRVMILLSVKAGLRAGEIARLDWSMVLDARGRLGTMIELPNGVAKKGSGRLIPMNPYLRKALADLRAVEFARHGRVEGAVIKSARSVDGNGLRGRGGMRASSIVNWFAELYRSLGFAGCSSHSGRRTFITNAARLVYRAGGSLRDVQELAGHRSIAMTQRYIEGDTPAKRRLVRLI